MPTALVTGAGGGIGAETARRLAHDRYDVILMGRKREPLASVCAQITAGGGSARVVEADVSDSASIRDGIALAEEMAVVVNNAAIIGPIAPLADADEAQWKETLLVNLLGPFHVARATMPLLIACGRGTIINVSSIAAIRPIPAWSAYCASKAGLSMLTRSIAAEYGQVGIRTFDLCLGPVDTPMRDVIRMRDPSRTKEDKRLLASPRTVAEAISWLCTVDADGLAGCQVRLEDIPVAAK